MFFKKDKLYLHSFVRYIANFIIQTDGAMKKVGIEGFSEIDKNKLISRDEREKLLEESIYIRFTLFNFLLLDIPIFGKKRYSPEERGQILGTAISLAYQDNGITEEEISRRLDVFIERVQHYSLLLSNTNPKELQSKGIFYHLVRYFTDTIYNIESDISDTNKNKEQSMIKHGLIFVITNRLYKQDNEFFRKYLRQVKFIDD